MRIVILGSAYPFRGGLAIYNERLAQELTRLGHTVRIYTFTVQYPRWLFPGKTQFRTGPPPEGIAIYRRVHAFGPLSWWQTAQELRKWNPELALAKFWLPVMGISLGSTLKLLPPPTVRLTILDNVIPHEKRVGDKFFIRYFISAVDGAIAMSRAVAKDWQLFTQKPLLQLFHPLYDHYGEALPKVEACETLGLDPQYRYLLFFGLIRAYKGLDLLLEAWRSDELRKFTDTKLLIAGELYEPYEKYQPYLEAPEMQGRVIFHEGFVPEEKVRYYFCAADAIVQPYRTATQSGITQIAYHFEKPMIVTNVGGLPEMVPAGEVGFVCEPTTVALIESIRKFLSTPSHTFKSALQEQKKRYSWESFARALLEFTANLNRYPSRWFGGS
ncbi:MAG: glycosyltransferase family 4 protein [Bacteroidia bacterium]|nr:glycosyltransferase family 4 protein [Bacteroidia bacterium]MDW8133771.1 glycosyltransferase family 4 protein [Bacteroidia bacterium]